MQRPVSFRSALARLGAAGLAGSILAAAVAASALASGPTITSSMVTFAGVYGPAPCVLHDSGVSTSRTESFYDDTGALALVRRHMTFDGTLLNVASGRSVPYEGEATITIDIAAGTRTVTGQTRRTDLPGQPPLLASGRTVFALAGPPTVIDESGLTTESYGAEICALTS
jgi:hypothetical protein